MSNEDKKWFIVASTNGSKVTRIVYAEYELYVRNKFGLPIEEFTVHLLTWGQAVHLLGAILPPNVGVTQPVIAGLSVHRGDIQIFISVL